MNNRWRRYAPVVAAVLVVFVSAIVAAIVSLSPSHVESSDLQKPGTVEVTAPHHMAIEDATGTPSLPAPKQHCMTAGELNALIAAEMSSFQHSIGHIVCQDGWLYSDVSGMDLGNGQVSDSTRILLFYIEPAPGGQGQWDVVVKGGTDKAPGDDPVCQRPIPTTMKSKVCY